MNPPVVAQWWLVAMVVRLWYLYHEKNTKMGWLIHYWLVVWNMLYFSVYWECHNPN